MAAPATYRQLFVRLRFTNDAAAKLVDDQGIDDLDKIRHLNREDAHNLCKIIRKPGGQMLNPAYNAVAPVPGVPRNISDPGCTVLH